MPRAQHLRFIQRIALILGLAALSSLVAYSPALAGRRVALIIGNSAYQNVPRLDNPRNDAKLMARTLRSLGFDLVGGDAQVDLDKARFEGVLKSFSDQVQGADVGLFYYAGHGVQVGGRNFLVPVEANPAKEADVYLQMIDTSIVLSQMEGAGTKLNIVLLDACRNSPFHESGTRAAGGGLAQMQAPEGTLISYATQPGNVALDGADGDSPYTTALARTIGKPGLGLFDTFNEVGLSVKRATGGAQLPWVSSSPIEGGFMFAPPPAGAAIAATAMSKASPTQMAQADIARTTAAAAPTQMASLEAQPAATAPKETPIGACDRLAASTSDPARPAGVSGVEFDDIDPAPAVAACRAALAEQPANARVMFQLARAVSKSGGVDEALALFRKAAAAGDAGAMNNLGLAYANGRGVTRDLGLSARWTRKSAEAGDGAAMHRLGEAYLKGEGETKDVVEAFRWFRKSADAGNVYGMTAVGKAYTHGVGVEKNPGEAARWYRKAADAGDAVAMDRLGAAYLNGVGVARDPGEAVRWFRKGAEAGNQYAMENLGNAYKDGVGVTRDDAEAQRWLQKAKQ